MSDQKEDEKTSNDGHHSDSFRCSSTPLNLEAVSRCICEPLELSKVIVFSSISMIALRLMEMKAYERTDRACTSPSRFLPHSQVLIHVQLDVVLLIRVR